MAEIVSMPKLGFDMAEGTLVRWVVNEGETVVKGAILAEIETDKATVEIESPYSGVMARHLVPQGEVAPVNTPIAIIAAPGEQIDALPAHQPSSAAAPASAAAPTSVAALQIPAAPTAPPTGMLKASPLARRIAQEMGIDLKTVRGSGPDGRITKKDLQSHIATPPAPISAAPPPSTPAPVSAAMLSGAPSRLRAAIGRRMAEAKQQIPHFYVTHEYDMQALMALRTQVNNLLPEEEKISVNDFIVKAISLALRQFPNLNASLQGEQIVQHAQVNVGVAVAVEGGLLTIVCRDSDSKPLRQIASEVRMMVKRARDGKVRPEDIEGSTFSISNLGMFDVEHFIAIINPPEAAILAVGSVREAPVVQNGEIKPGLRMKATLSVDHRVSDGAEAARFLQALAQYLEEPVGLLI